MITLQDVLAARERIRGDVEVTPCPRSWTFSDLCGASVYFKLESENGYVFIHAFDDDEIIAGQGTAALEILEQVPDVDLLVASVGGGGFLGGMATVIKALKPSVRVVGVESAALAKMAAARKAG